MSAKKKESLAENIAQILTTAPVSFDVDDNEADLVTPSQLATTNEEEDQDTQEEEILSKFRKKNIDLLGDIDEKYAGKKASRRDLQEEDSSSQEDEELLESAKSDSEESGLQETNNDEESSLDEEEEDYSISNLESDQEDEDNFKHMNDENNSAQMKKAHCVRNQLSIWETLLETRIQLQKCLVAANKMPSSSNFGVLKQQFENEFTGPVAKTKNNLSDVLGKLLSLQSVLLKKFPETKNLDGNKDATENEELDEEIPSDTDGESSDKEEQTDAADKGKKRKLQDYAKDIESQFKKYKTYRDSVIQKWNDKTRIVAKSDSSSHTILNQINYTLTNKEKLIKKTQLKRSQYQILLEEQQVDNRDDVEENDKSGEEYNKEIFDDDDFYHQLLRELIEFKSSDITDPVQLGRQWIQLQSLRSKMKRKIDTKATKGRKIRYAVHSKLVNFMAPMDENLWTEEAKNELCNSLFGKNQPVKNK